MGSTRICVQLCIFVAFIAAVVEADRDIFLSECPGPLTYYKDLRCTPIYDDKKDNCPKSFNCNHIKRRSRDKCYINGRIYGPNQVLNPNDSNFCDISCICRVSFIQNQIAAFQCSKHSQCTEIEVKNGCYLRQNPTTCCKNQKQICPKKLEDIPVCDVNNHIYLDGEYFKVNEEPDLICICQPGYKGENVPPFCIKPNHSPCFHPAFNHDDYFRRNCAPVFKDYVKKNTCYETMLCQLPGDVVIPSRLPFMMDDNYSNMCIFGNLLLQIGDRLQPTPSYTTECINCICEVPPVLTCIYISKNNCSINYFVNL
ncbi:PREDICTED: uncharacterized protein LOC105149532 [Acromyrmex echinatior]|uniref:VWFC domain-containing protein n=1 Tax=Acromyrmex echinatior TaxID=103372 RepID=F4WV92_ACREC|nr:PREDICTED: uncharacterized protein LOC105149532 [Acromyrmex echinatior]EGI61858.1 hypothetical protein G5I_09759 [Acromyrmex echinatior]